jgi:hypothetical protein
MATKNQVLAKAKKLNCVVELTGYDIAVKAPKGKLLGGELHISVYDLELYSKAEIWSNLLSDMDYMEDCNGSDYCLCEEVA